MEQKTPLYNLKAVVREVGLSPAVLRAWERRYNIFKLQRTSGGHRLYTRQDIELLKWLVERQKEGLGIRTAVELWKSQPESRRDLLSQGFAPGAITTPGEVIFDAIRENWIAACSEFKVQAADQVLDQAFAIAPPETICTEVLLKSLAYVGEGWYRGTTTVQQEHAVSALTARRIQTLLSATSSLPTRQAGRILAACPAGEEHDLILLTVTYFLRRYGWEVVYLGADVPLGDLDLTIKTASPILVISAAQTLKGAASLRSMAEYIVSLGIPLAYGGGVFVRIPAVRESIPGLYLGDDITHAAQVVDRILSAPTAVSSNRPLPVEYSLVLKIFKLKEAQIMTSLNEALEAGGFTPENIEISSRTLVEEIASALVLGDVSFADGSVSWLIGLLKNRGIPVTQLVNYLSTFRQVTEAQLGIEGKIIVDWLSKPRNTVSITE